MVGPSPGVEARAWCSALAMLTFIAACGDGGAGPGGADGGSGADSARSDGGPEPTDGGSDPGDGAVPGEDAHVFPGDSGPAVPEVCSGGGDEDGDGAAD